MRHGMVPTEQRNAGDQEQHAESRPQKSGCRRPIADERLQGPIVGVGDLLVDDAGLRRHHRIAGLARALGGRGPRRPPEERGECTAMFGRRHRVVLHRVGFAQFLRRRIVAEQALVMRGDVRQRRDAILDQRDGPGLGVVRVLPHHFLQAALQCGLALGGQLRVRGHRIVGARPDVEHADSLAMQPVRAPVGRDISAMAPDGAQLHPAHRLPHLATALDVGLGVDHLAAFAHHAFGHRRCGTENLGPGPHQYAERDDEQGAKAQPQLPRVAHIASPNTSTACSAGSSHAALIQIKLRNACVKSATQWCACGAFLTRSGVNPLGRSLESSRSCGLTLRSVCANPPGQFRRIGAARASSASGLVNSSSRRSTDSNPSVWKRFSTRLTVSGASRR